MKNYASGEQPAIGDRVAATETGAEYTVIAIADQTLILTRPGTGETYRWPGDPAYLKLLTRE